MTYLIEASAQIQQANDEEEKKNAQEERKSDQISVVFCIDISGSMNQHGRLQACKQAITNQINAMAESNPDRKIGIVTFEGAVEIIGDSVEKPISIDNHIMNDYDKILENGLEQGDKRLKNPISETKNHLLQRVASLKHKGMTALGPGALTSIAMASRGAPGS